MNNTVRKLIGSAVTFVVSVFLLLLIPKVDNGKFFALLRAGGPLSRKIRFMLRAMPGEFILMLLFFALILVALIMLLRASLLLRRLDAPAGADEAALGCDHKTGRDRYLEQLENYLESGVIDREEYNSMRARYEQQNIPDDYHG